MSDVSKTNELIADAQAFRGSSDQYAEFITELADALEAATRVPVQGEPNDDREALANLLDEIHDPLITEGGCHFSGWSGGGFAGQREVSDSVDALIARWPRATVPDAATELRAERDAALAAIAAARVVCLQLGRVDGDVSQPAPSYYVSVGRNVVATEVLAAIDEAPEPEVKP